MRQRKAAKDRDIDQLVVACTNQHELIQLIHRANTAGQQVVLGFMDSFSTPGQALRTVIGRLSAEHAGRVVFVRVNVEQCEDELKRQWRVVAVPTVVFLRDGVEPEDGRILGVREVLEALRLRLQAKEAVSAPGQQVS